MRHAQFGRPRAAAILLSAPLQFWVAADCRADRPLEYTAEHLVESAMNARYLSFPTIPSASDQGQTAAQLGYLSYASGKFSASASLLGLQYYQAADQSSGWLLGAFLDSLKFSGQRGAAVASLNFLQNSTPLDVDVTAIHGQGSHYGISAAKAWQTGNGHSWQAGVAFERLQIRELGVNFDTTGLPSNVQGRLDFAASYNAITPYAAHQWNALFNAGGFTHDASVILAIPLPRQGFSGKVSSPLINGAGDTAIARHDKVIPDPYFGVGYALSNPSTGVRIDLGAALYHAVAEPVLHRGIRHPLFITVSFRR